MTSSAAPAAPLSLRPPRQSVFLHSLVSVPANSPFPASGSLTDAAASIHQTCQRLGRPVSVAELAARLQVSSAVIAVAVADLLGLGLLHLHESVVRNRTVLERILGRLRNGGQSAVRLVKMVVLGAPGSGVTSFVGHVADSTPLAYTDPADGTRIDVGACAIDPELQLALFGASGVDAAAPQWPDLVRHALGAVVLAHSEHIADAGSAVQSLRDHNLPFAVAVNLFGDADPAAGQVRHVLGLPEAVPVIMGDARFCSSVTSVLLDLCAYLLTDPDRSL